ncbi:MAG: hypothetical protein EXR71_03005 [Myxococcales bacterium]|nr:hypothetical protein [Myxococcales bacterium]
MGTPRLSRGGRGDAAGVGGPPAGGVATAGPAASRARNRSGGMAPTMSPHPRPRPGQSRLR